MALWLVHSTLDRKVQVRALAGSFELCSWAKHFILMVALSSQEYKIMGTGELSGKPDEMLGVTCEGLASHPRRSSNTPSHLMLRKPG